MLLTLILGANFSITLAELGSMSCLKQVYGQRFLCSMEHKTFKRSSLPDNPSFKKWQLFCNFIHPYTLMYMFLYVPTDTLRILWIIAFLEHLLGLHKCL